MEKGKYIRTEEFKKKLSMARQGKNACHYGKKHSKSAKKKMSKAKMGKPISEEHKKATSEGHKGLKHTKEAIQNMCIAQTKRQTREREERERLLKEFKTNFFREHP